MQLTDDGTGKSGPQGRQVGPQIELPAVCRDTAEALLRSIIETACEHEHSLDLMRFVNYLDLYRVYLAHLHPGNSGDVDSDSLLQSQPLSFEHFVGDSKLLLSTSAIAARLSGEKVAAPAPLVPSANESVFRSQ